MVVKNQPGALATATAIFAKDHANIVNLSLRHRDTAFYTFIVDLEVKNLQHLNRIIAALSATDVVSSADRLEGYRRLRLRDYLEIPSGFGKSFGQIGQASCRDRM